MADQVQEIKGKIDIVDVIGEYVNLKRAGRNFKGLCPFHNEKSPSFMVNPELQIYKCFGCQESGDVFTFLQKHEGLEFYEALEILANRAGVVLKKFESKNADEKQAIKEANFQAARFYNYILLNHKNGEYALDYLLKTRGLTLEVIKKFNLGYAPDEWSVLFEFLNKKKNFSEKQIDAAGLSYKGPRGFIDRFRGRIIFPISDHRGNVIALAGRIMPGSKKDLAKYINSPETLIYKKSFSLYGIDKAKHEIKKSGTAILTEGELDMLSTYQSGIKNVVAIKGTALTQEQVVLISRFAKTIILALDADFAGDNAALRGITLAQNQDLEIKVCNMGEYKDPDEFAQKDPAGYKDALTNAQDVWDFLIDLTVERFDLSTGPGKSKASKFLLPFLSRLTDQVLRDHYIQEFARKISANPGVLVSQMTNPTTPRLRRAGPTDKSSVKSRRELLEEDILRLGLNFFPEKIVEENVLSNIKTKFVKRIIRLLKNYLGIDSGSGPGMTVDRFNLKEFSKDIPEEFKEQYNKLMFSPTEEKTPEKSFEMATHELALLSIKEKISKIASKIAKFEQEGKVDLLKNEQKNFKQLTQTLKKLEESRI